MKLLRRNNSTPHAGPDNTTPDRRGGTRAVRRLRSKLAEAHDVHALSADPLLSAVTAERFRVSVTRTMWFFLAIGLGFTTTGVHDFLAGGLPLSDPLWWGAWLVEPALAGILINLLRWEAQMIAAGIDVDSRWVTGLKWVLLGATLITNAWSALAPSEGAVNPGNVFLHLLIPLVVFLLAEVMPVMQARCITARDNAFNALPAPVDTASPVDTTPVVDAPAADALAVDGPVAQLAPVPAPAVDPVRVVSALRLPPHMSHALTTRMSELGRPLDAHEVGELLRVPDAFAARVADHLAA
ncbi:hypothetical protein [Saccharothrix longispora]|uniref:hypothetical protein n=1 Tax=Saccharothrix longispora TaxID=33920 RepID=UPI0028FD7057|nr:hypothetical protein [Saccharothrix longispora]MDU0290733.1 hypothetical protein [Saccharothrix longispora]